MSTEKIKIAAKPEFYCPCCGFKFDLVQSDGYFAISSYSLFLIPKEEGISAESQAEKGGMK